MSEAFPFQRMIGFWVLLSLSRHKVPAHKASMITIVHFVSLIAKL